MAFLPLAGTRVLDLTSSLAGPTATAILGALGADVIKVEHPERGDEARAWGREFFDGGSVMFFAANAGKRSLALDLAAPAGLEALLRLGETADALVQSLRPGTAERLGCGPDALRARNPRLVYASIGAFGRTGPLAREPGYDPLLQAAAGIMSVTGEADGPPVRVGASLVDLGTGVWAALAIVAALHEGAGRTLDLSLYETAVSLVHYQLTDVLAGGEPPGRHGTAFPLIVPYQVFPASDGELMVVAGNDRLFAQLCEAVGAPGLADDPRFATNPLRVEHRGELIPLLEQATAAHTADDLLARLREAGVPASPVHDLADVARSEQLHALGILQEVAGQHLVSPPLTADGERVRYRSEPPLLGEHTAEILGAAGYSAEEVAALEEAGVVRVGKPPAR
ncbi:MAG TPA: CoA transferase [Gaiellaceae bacterium]|jgi:crotonobetainyl-CoA:carnitine CoA-transferase CaiB-like acyl-CoA transferase